MRSNALGSSANSKQSNQPFLRYLIGYETQLGLLADQIMQEWLIGLLRVG
jgi:hypothetical protein